MNGLMLDVTAGLLVSVSALAARRPRARFRGTRGQAILSAEAGSRTIYTPARTRASTHGAGLAGPAGLLMLARRPRSHRGATPRPLSPPLPLPTADNLDRPAFLQRRHGHTNRSCTSTSKRGTRTPTATATVSRPIGKTGPRCSPAWVLIEDRLEFRVIWSGYVAAKTSDSGGITSSTANGAS